MKKAMTILLTFIMVLQLIPIPAFATEEIATAEDLKAFLENPENVTVAEGSTLTVQISAENKLTNLFIFKWVQQLNAIAKKMSDITNFFENTTMDGAIKRDIIYKTKNKTTSIYRSRHIK